MNKENMRQQGNVKIKCLSNTGEKNGIETGGEGCQESDNNTEEAEGISEKELAVFYM